MFQLRNSLYVLVLALLFYMSQYIFLSFLSMHKSAICLAKTFKKRPAKLSKQAALDALVFLK